MLRYGLGVWLGAAAGIALSRLDQAIFLPLSTAYELGVYAAGVSIAEAARVFNTAVRDVVFATQAKEQDWDRLAQAARISSIITAAVGLVVGVGSIYAVPLLFGPGFAGSIAVIAILLVGTVVSNPGSVLAAGLSASGKPILRSMAILAGVVVNVFLLVLWAPAFGAVGAALATAVANLGTAVIILVLARAVFALRAGPFLFWRSADFRYLVREISKRVAARRTEGEGPSQVVPAAGTDSTDE
jgi:O-antigen/teichoic acid export membrane protein